MSREAFEAFYMTLAESNRSDLYRTTKPFRGVQIGDYKWTVARSMYIGWQAAEQLKQAKVDQLRAIANDLAANAVCGNSICGTGGGVCLSCAALAGRINIG